MYFDGQNTTVMLGNETVISESLTDNPKLRFYILVYGCSIISVLVSMVLRAVLFVKVCDNKFISSYMYIYLTECTCISFVKDCII